MVTKKIETRDYLRKFITRANKEAEEAGKAREKAENYSQFYEKMTKKWQEHYFREKDNCKIANSKLNDLSIITFGLGAISIVEAISIAILAWK